MFTCVLAEAGPAYFSKKVMLRLFLKRAVLLAFRVALGPPLSEADDRLSGLCDRPRRPFLLNVVCGNYPAKPRKREWFNLSINFHLALSRASLFSNFR